MGGARICFAGRRHERKERLLVPEGGLRWREGSRLCLKERRHGRKAYSSCQKDAFAGEMGALCAYKGAAIREKGVFVPEESLHSQEVAVSA